MKLTQIPKKPFKNFQAYVAYMRRQYGWRDRLWPCSQCHGTGRVTRAEDRDPIEGYKLAPRYDCITCAGTGERSEATYRAWYKMRTELWKKERAQAVERLALQKAALEKLSEEERSALGL